MKAGPVTVRQLLENRQRFCVPIYQRHYVWGRDKQWEPFWNEIRTKAIELLNGRERRFSHFMGAIVLEARGTVSARQVKSFQVVDGQQRLTTFQIFLAAARDYAQQEGFESTVGLIEGHLFNEREHLMDNPSVERYKVWPTKYDRELFKDIVSVGRDELRKKYREHFYKDQDKIYKYNTVPNLLGAYGYFFDSIKHAVESDDIKDESAESVEIPGINSEPNAMELRLNALCESLIEEFKIVEIILEEGEDAQVIFETLNERGEPLLVSDLVRNNIFQRADAGLENAEELFEKYWKEFEDPFWEETEGQGRNKKKRIELFLANFIAGKIAGEISISKLFSEYKAFIKEQNSKTTGGYPSVEAELHDLADFGLLYRRLLERNDEDPLGSFARHLVPWDTTTVYPLVLRLWAVDSLQNDAKKSCLDMLLAFIVRRAICKLTSRGYNRFFLSALRHLEATEFSQHELRLFLTRQTSKSFRFPTDAEFKTAWISNPAYKDLSPQRVRTVLEAIERKKRQNYHETDQLADNLSVEHILPVQWEEHWPLPSGEVPTSEDKIQAFFATEENDTRIGEIVRRGRMLHTFGNLTILTTPLNASVSNGPYNAKREVIREHSLLVLNREIIEHDNWSEEQIEARGENLFEDALELWPYPSPNN